MSEDGVTLLDYFAAKMTIDDAEFPPTTGESERFVGSPCPDHGAAYTAWLEWSSKLEAKIRYAKARAMLAEHNKEVE